jgi:hypothetical protein
MTSIWDRQLGDLSRGPSKAKRKKRKAKGRDETAHYFVIAAFAFILIIIFAGDFSCKKSENSSSGVPISTESKTQNGQSTKASANANQGTLKYSCVKKQNISYAQAPRMVWRIRLDVADIPAEAQIRQTALEIWESQNGHWHEFTVFVYLPEMNTEDLAYATAEFTKIGLKAFRIEPLSLLGTKWEKESGISVEKTAVPSPNTSVKKKKSIFVNLEVVRTKPRDIQIVIKTNFPEGTLLHVTVARDFNETGDSETKVGDIWQEKIKVTGGNIVRDVYIDDKRWQIFSSVTWASPTIEISVMMTPVSQTEDVLEIIGKKAEYITGSGVEKTEFGFYWFKISKKLSIPFERATPIP